ncbi:MAG: hypothetical protein PVH84_10505 [Candidatus Aminicenantes bacterium]
MSIGSDFFGSGGLEDCMDASAVGNIRSNWSDAATPRIKFGKSGAAT